MARPTDYRGDETIKACRAYLDQCVDEYEEFHKTRGEKSDSYDRLVRVRLPTVEGLSLHLGVSRDTCYEWEKHHPAFSDILEELKTKQHARLVEGSLSGDYNPLISKMLLSAKHGVVEKTATDLTTNGERIVAINYVAPQTTDAHPQADA